MTTATPGWIASIEADAPDVIACWRALDPSWSGLKAMRRELRARVSDGAAPVILAQQERIGEALGAVMRDLPQRLLSAPGGEGDWNVAQAFAHTTAARRFLAAWAALDAGEDRSAERDLPTIVPSVPGPSEATRAQLLVLLEKSSRSLRRAAEQIQGSETQRCRVEHPLVGRLRCGDWLLFVGVHDLMHLEQLHRLVESDA